MQIAADLAATRGFSAISSQKLVRMSDNTMSAVPPADEDSQAGPSGAAPHVPASDSPAASLPASLANPTAPPRHQTQPGPVPYPIRRPGTIRSDSDGRHPGPIRSDTDGSDFGSGSSLIAPLIRDSSASPASRVPPARQRFILYTPFASASSENSSFPHTTKCIHCSRVTV